jgi:hypothetical protein
MPGKKPSELFGRRVRKLFQDRRAELLKKLNRLEQRQKEGWGYRKTWRKAHKVPAHNVRAHWAWLPVKRK